MHAAQVETARRRAIAQKLADSFQDSTTTIMIAGSVAYSENHQVRPDSDLDLVIFNEQIKNTLQLLNLPLAEKIALKTRYFEGYCLKESVEGVPVSIHVLSNDALEIISRCFVANIRVYRSEPKAETYHLYGFERNHYPYAIKNIPLSEMRGVRTIVPVSFINNDRYYLGIHRDKMLSKPVVLHDRHGRLGHAIDRTWMVVIDNLLDEARRLYGGLDLSRMNICNALSKRDNFSQEAIDHINDRTNYCLAKLL